MSRSFRNRDNGIFKVLSYCNLRTEDDLDYAISHAILMAGREGSELSVAHLARVSHASPASVSRYLRRMGFASFKQFSGSYQKSLVQLNLRRQLAHHTRFGDTDVEDLRRQLQLEAAENLSATSARLKSSRLRAISERIRNADTVTLLGDDVSLALFSTFQMDLMAAGIPCFSYRTQEIQMRHLRSLRQRDVLLCACFRNSMLETPLRNQLQKLRRRNVFRIGILQDEDPETERLFDETLHFGRADRGVEGFYSLLYISRLLSEMLYLEDGQ